MVERARVVKVQSSSPTSDGAGVRLFRAFGHGDTKLADPFMMLDDFHSSDPEDYLAGFPFHPHRGIETVTYVESGLIEHQDSLGNKGAIGSGDVQWMTAGSGILHQEMPQRWEGMMQGFQLWVNLPRAHKMMTPRYRDVKAKDIPIVQTPGGKVKVVAGEFGGVRGPVRDLMVRVRLFIVSLDPLGVFEHEIGPGDNGFVYAYRGDARIEKERLGKMQAAFFTEGALAITAGDEGASFLFAVGTPLREPIAWSGPIAMNTQSELDQAFRELRQGIFVRARPRMETP
ncbi:MAG TPA: pirin family protein [Methanomassiliicoccales archaeon]|nr:pirin family protein [Methanomassiliicoccales archaeon]